MLKLKVEEAEIYGAVTSRSQIISSCSVVFCHGLMEGGGVFSLVCPV